MSSSVACKMKPVDALEVTVLVDNVVDPLSTVPAGVTGEQAVLQANGFMVSSGHVRCCANHGLSLVITARVGEPAEKCQGIVLRVADYLELGIHPVRHA